MIRLRTRCKETPQLRRRARHTATRVRCIAIPRADGEHRGARKMRESVKTTARARQNRNMLCAGEQRAGYPSGISEGSNGNFDSRFANTLARAEFCERALACFAGGGPP